MFLTTEAPKKRQTEEALEIRRESSRAGDPTGVFSQEVDKPHRVALNT